MAHLVWDWNGTLLDDLWLVVEATNASLATYGAGPVTADEHRRDFRRPVADYYAGVLGRPVDAEEFAQLDKVFHEAYRSGLHRCALTEGAAEAMAAWPGTQSLLSMYFHDELVPAVSVHGLVAKLSRVDGLRVGANGMPKAPFLASHLDALGVAGEDCVLIGDSIDDADAAAAVGARIVLYSGGFTDEERLRATGHPVARTLSAAIALAVR